MFERGIRDDTFFVCGFVDWNVDSEMSLTLASYKKSGYRTKRVGKNLYYACIKGRIRGILKYARVAL